MFHFCYFLLLIFTTCFLSSTNGVGSTDYMVGVKKFSDFLLSTFANVTRFDVIKQGFQSTVVDKLIFETVNADNALNKAQRDISDYLNDKMKALKSLVAVAEESAVEVDYYETLSEKDVENYTYANLREFSPTFNEMDQSGVHVPLDVYIGDKYVIRDIRWTDNIEILLQFIKNNDRQNKWQRQYIATHSGITRIYPAREWKLEPPLMTVDLFDPRYRPWFTSAITCPKDILFLLDYSGSVLGQTLRLMKLTVMTIMASLTPDDYMNAIWFNNKADVVLTKCFHGFVPATTRNKILLHSHLDDTDPHGEANFTLGIGNAYTAFINLTNQTDVLHELNYGAGCHKMLIVMTDSTEDHTEQVFNRLHLKEENGTMNVSVRFFGIAMGFGVKSIRLLEELSCMHRGYYTQIDSFEDIKLQSRMFFPVLSRPLALTFGNENVNVRPVTWTGPYMDAQGAGPLLTLSMPIVNRMQNGSDQEFLGVAAIDLSLSEIQTFLKTNDLSSDAYYFITDGNGHIIYHPRRRLPDPDYQMIRRSACFDASANKSGDATVLFTEATEETYAKMGYYETIPHLDLVEIEYDNEQLEQHHAEKREIVYKCRSILNTSFSLALAVPKSGKKGVRLKPDVDVSDDYLIEHSSIFWTSSPRVHCGVDFGAVKMDKRATIFNHTVHTCQKMNEQTKRLLLDFQALSPWVSRLPEIDNTSACFEDTFPIESILPVFIQSEGGLTVSYPGCFMSKYYQEFLNFDTWNSDQYAMATLLPNSLTVTPSSEPGLINMMQVISSENYPFAVVGVVYSVDNFFQHFRNVTWLDFNECWESNKKWCHIFNRDMIVFGSNVESWNFRENHLSKVDAKLFEYLFNQSLMSNFSFKDYQSKCSTEEPPANTVNKANSVSYTVIRWLFDLFGSFKWLFDQTLWLHLWTFVLNFFTPAKAHLPNCQFKFPKKEKNCILLKHFYTLDLTVPHDGEISDVCTRKVNILPVPNTNLFVAVVDKPCDCNKHCSTYLKVEPDRKECTEMKLRYRNPRHEYCMSYHPLENTTVCSNANKLNFVNLKSYFIYFILLVHFLCPLV